MVAAKEVDGDAEQPGPGTTPVGAVVAAPFPRCQERLGHDVLGLDRPDLPGQKAPQPRRMLVEERGEPVCRIRWEFHRMGGASGTPTLTSGSPGARSPGGLSWACSCAGPAGSGSPPSPSR